jgi:uncharacterized protein (DUF433 family)
LLRNVWAVRSGIKTEGIVADYPGLDTDVFKACLYVAVNIKHHLTRIPAM